MVVGGGLIVAVGRLVLVVAGVATLLGLLVLALVLLVFGRGILGTVLLRKEGEEKRVER